MTDEQKRYLVLDLLLAERIGDWSRLETMGGALMLSWGFPTDLAELEAVVREVMETATHELDELDGNLN